ncbi:hypothetical protein HPL003_14255 [Paenibacillus terrae HPL-003]|uniref:Uncharacterized protein n=1 Tax=Paenibacillus terrae (strain HPL-003) TaxID=985665 RepID=G7W0I1_PAETH|nr:hypothetical protein [Paenibacillus terrae]AET59602.1 hypothetical protein HPL003_14255 [Paenibacillus terrae HPL-003]
MINIFGGGNNMFNDNSRNMNGANFQGATFTGNQNFLSGNNNQSFQSGLSTETEELFEKVLEEIKRTIQDTEEQQDILKT